MLCRYYAVLYTRQPRDGVARWDGSRLASGLYFWLVRAQRLRATKGCPTRIRSSGKIAWSDNEETTDAQATYSISLKSGSRLVGRLRGSFDRISTRFDGAIGSKRRVTAGRLTATASLRDGGDHLVTGEPRQVRISGAPSG
ncbi:hypothetical protein OM076_29490 [Solirubrobacter ginsenosidimutans]|uniref:Uncharacterized protein n=1 Tax=Solirubrobacter ginsenosidimutans TaxID=490573 RepID=A0A9X3MX91_9ACTN|nr:hypothetical protein [Solirubrobacter ginsenosidimutans]MDA0164440.1 hypothetical protein [Solirubrobacter ginsenosidimutans]